MKVLKVELVLFVVILLLVTAVPVKSYAGQIRIEFSGIFSECLPVCEGTLVENLFDQPFSGVLEIPDAETSGAPYLETVAFPFEADRGLYVFDVPSFMTFTTGVSEFDLIAKKPVNVIVQKCTDLACPRNQDYVWIYVINGSYLYSFQLSAPPSPFEAVLIPSVRQLRELTASMEIFKLDGSEGINTVPGSSTFNTIISNVPPELDSDSLLHFLPAILSGLKTKGPE